MRLVIQRAKNAKVIVAEEIIGAIDFGLVILVGITHEDTEKDAKTLANKVVNLRIFEDEQGSMNLSLKDIAGSILSISQFTLYGDTKKGRRPSFTNAAKPEQANILYEQFNEILRAEGIHLETGQFGADMDVQLTNNGPVTFILDSE